MTVQVTVWKPWIMTQGHTKRYVSAREARSKGGSIGHAGLKFHDDQGHEGYVSWVPDPTKTHHDPVSWYTPKVLYTSTATPVLGQGFDDDVNLENEEFPDHMIKLSKNGYGLSDSAIARWWNIFKRAGKWKTRDENCSTVVATALRMGGADMFVPAPSHYYWDPEDVLNYAREIRNVINARYKYLGPAMAKIPREYRNLYPGGRQEEDQSLWTREQFQKASAVWGANRYRLLKDIDNLLDRYWTLDKVRDRDRDIDQQIQTLEDILIKIHEQTLSRPTSKRKGAILRLGEQVLHRRGQLLSGRSGILDVDSPVIGTHINNSHSPEAAMCRDHGYPLLECPMC